MADQEKAKCKVDKCKREVRAKGYCRIHYKKWRQNEFGDGRFKICKAEGCKKQRHLMAYCEEHYNSLHLNKTAEAAAAGAPK